MSERRPLFRKRVLWSGKGVHSGGEQSFGCTIRDWTDHGARIAVRGTPMIPNRFFLLNLTARTLHDASVVWSDGKEVGLRFANNMPFDAINDPNLLFLRRHIA